MFDILKNATFHMMQWYIVASSIKTPPSLLGYIELEGIKTFWAQKSDKKNCHNSKWLFELHQIFRYNFLNQKASILPLYIFLTRKIDTFWSWGISSIRGIRTFWLKNSWKFFELFQVFMCKTIAIFYVSKCLNTLKFYTTDALKTLISSNGSTSIFSFSDMLKFHHLLGSSATGINSLLIFFSVVYFF